ncbi:MAG: LuxR family transcriptional regulator [Eggerthellaceae bacterium]|nr:LuxR family transcriptional regulator [Eggerthellaceae bacterium]
MGILQTLKSIRGYRGAEVFAMLGLAFALVAMESWRAPNVAAGVSGANTSLVSASDLLVIALALLALLYLKLRPHLVDRPWVLPAVSFLAAAAIFCYVGLPEDPSPLLRGFTLLHAAFAGALFVLWIEVVLEHYADDLAGFMAFTLIATFLIQIAFVVLHTENIRGFTALIPVLSALCFVGFEMLIAKRVTATPADVGEVEVPAAEGGLTALVEEAAVRLPKTPRTHPVLHYVFVCLAWICCGIIFSMLFRTWYTSDAYAAGHLYSEIQVFTALGTLVAAAVLLLLSHPVRRGLIEIIIVAMVLAAILFSSMGTKVVLVYLIPFNTAQKLIFVSMLRGASEAEDSQKGMALFCVLLGSYRLGLALSARIRNLFVGEPFLFTPDSVNFGIFAVCAAVLLAFFIVEIASMLRQAQNATVEAASEAMAEVDAIAAAKEAKYREGAFHYYLMQKFDLTQRESEVLRLFETGLSVKEIAEEQVVSESTVKTHLSNVYPKLGVKTRKDALKKVQSERENFFTA